MDFVYNIPNVILLILFITVMVSISLVGLYYFNELTYDRTYNDNNTGVFLAAISIVIGVTLAFIVTNEWTKYSDAQENQIEEANFLNLIYQTALVLPNTECIQRSLVNYLCSIVNLEFPAMQSGQLPESSECFYRFQESILLYNVDLNNKQLILYTQMLDYFNQSVSLRNKRLQSAIIGLPQELWWMMIFGYIITMVMMWFISGDLRYRLLMNGFVISVYATVLFLAVVLDYPYRGQFSLTPAPYQFVLNSIPASCANVNLNCLVGCV